MGMVAIDLALDADSALVQVAAGRQPFAPRAIDDDLRVSYTAFPAAQMRALVGSLGGTHKFPPVPEALEVQI